jgi:hypothetical protein
VSVTESRVRDNVKETRSRCYLLTTWRLSAMLSAPNSSSRPALVNRTNVFSESSTSHSNHWFAYPTSPEHGQADASGAEGGPKKRMKLNPKHEEVGESICGKDDVSIDDIAMVRARRRKNTIFYMMNAATMGRPCMPKRSCTLMSNFIVI